jgi:hypothetical protein
MMSMMYINARGNYCMYSLLQYDAGLLSVRLSGFVLTKSHSNQFLIQMGNRL